MEIKGPNNSYIQENHKIIIDHLIKQINKCLLKEFIKEKIHLALK